MIGTSNGMVLKPCIETQSGKTTLGHHSHERHGLQPWEARGSTTHAKNENNSLSSSAGHLLQGYSLNVLETGLEKI